MNTLRHKRVLVMGLGRFGGGAGAARFAAEQGAHVVVSDKAAAEQLAPALRQLDGLAIEYRLGEHRTEDFTGSDLIVVNPAVDPRDNAFLKAASEAGVPATSEIRLLAERLPVRQRTIGVTGTAGKSTVTAMIGHVLSAALGEGRVHAGGNLGGSLLTSLARIGAEDWVVLELSSFMLEGLALDRWSPAVSVLTNFSPNHLDRHGTIESYRAAKQAIFEHQEPGDQALMFRTDSAEFRAGEHGAGQQTILCEPDADARLRTGLLVPGRHNRLNAVLACTACECVGVSWDRAERLVSSFSGLPHRLQFVRDHTAVRYFNDSKSTTPQSARLGLASFEAGVVHAILGGYDKGSDLKELADVASTHCRAVYTIGETGPVIAAACTAAAGGAEVLGCETLDRAVAQITPRLRRGDVVLLSPGCASWDQFDNYEQRGAAFVEAVLNHTGEGAAPAGATADRALSTAEDAEGR